jgi:hypothetical protein
LRLRPITLPRWRLLAAWILVALGASLGTGWGLVGCAFDYTVAHEQACDDGEDGDGDGLVDCDDGDCAGSVHCIPEADCQNGLDDEGDGLTDCEDPDCELDPICLGPRPCTNDGVCDSFENCFWCPDCCPTCSLHEGTHEDYIAWEILIPTSAADASRIGVDLDGDGVVDNGLGALFGLFGADAGEDSQQDLQESIQDGEYILLARLVVDGFPNDSGVAMQLFPGLANPTVDATEDNLTGSGHALIDPEADRDAYLCGALTEGSFYTGPRSFVIPVGALGSIVYLSVQQARAESDGPINDSLMPAMHVGGGLTQHTINTQLLPFMAVNINDEIRNDPTDEVAQITLGFVDSGCRSDISGCGDVINGEGECAPWDGDPANPPISVTELRCSPFVASALQPDVDLDGDGVKDVLSVGVMFNALNITIDN